MFSLDSFYIFGAGKFAIRCFNMLKGMGYYPKAFLVSDVDENPKFIEGISVLNFSTVDSNGKKLPVIVALKNKARVVDELKKVNFTNLVFYPEINNLIRENFLYELRYKYEVYVFGAGKFGTQCVESFINNKIPVKNVIVSDKQNNPRQLNSIDVISLDDFVEYDNVNVCIVVALKQAYRNQICPELDKFKCKIMFYPEICNVYMQSDNKIDIRDVTQVPVNESKTVDPKSDVVDYNRLKGFIHYEIISNSDLNLRKKRNELLRKFPKFVPLFQFFENNMIEIFNENVLIQRLLDGVDFVLLISHEFDLTGAPVALQYFSQVVANINKCPLVVCSHEGPLEGELIKKNIPVAIVPDVYTSSFVLDSSNAIDLLVVCTLVGAPLINRLLGSELPVLWWVHEAECSYHLGQISVLPERLTPNINVFCGGKYAADVLKKYRPLYTVNQLLYTVPDFRFERTCRENFKIPNKKRRKVFACVGTIMDRKGQDVLCSAIELLSPTDLQKSIFYFIGRMYDKEISDKLNILLKKVPDNVRFIEQLEPLKLHSFYKQMDCLICSSRDDPMPIVVTDAFILSKPVICSENSGSSEFLMSYADNFVYKQNSSFELSECISKFLKFGYSGVLKKKNRRIYDENFSESVFEKNIRRIYMQIASKDLLVPDGMVSVVVPVYNGMGDLPVLIRCLKSQKLIGSLELVFIDSGSKDGSVDYAKKNGVKVVCISQNDFSHSYARNLGAKIAKGKYILFMTQDAVPNGDDWIVKLMQPILKERAVAVSCAETPKVDCDLFARVCIWNHSKYMNIIDTDVITSKPVNYNYNSLRKNGQLNDVTCLIRKDIFDMYKYRGDYAEDLDLGIRLIMDNYHLALLSNVTVIHSHNRPAYYHFRRGIVDVVNLKKILNDFPVEIIDKNTLLNQILTSAIMINSIYLIVKNCKKSNSIIELREKFVSNYEVALEQVKKMDKVDSLNNIQQMVGFNDSDLKIVLMELVKHLTEDFKFDFTMFQRQYDFMYNVVFDYLINNDVLYSENIENMYYDCLIKLFGSNIGNYLAYYLIQSDSLNDTFVDLIKKYMVGV